MEDKEDLSLPKTTVAKLIKEMLPPDVRCANDTRDLIEKCCVEFIHLISSEANEMCSKDNRKTIAPEHVISALKELGYEDYVSECNEVLAQHKVEMQEKPRGTTKLEDLGIPQEELLRQQQELFAKARQASQIMDEKEISDLKKEADALDEKEGDTKEEAKGDASTSGGLVISKEESQINLDTGVKLDVTQVAKKEEDSDEDYDEI